MSQFSKAVGFRLPYDGKRERPLLVCGPGRTKPEFKDECDINRILKKYRATGVLSFVNKAQPQFLDVTGADFQRFQDIVVGARQNFALLPSAIRNRFLNDPAKFLAWCEDPANKAEGAKMGLWPAEAAPEPAGAAPATPPAGSPAEAPQ